MNPHSIDWNLSGLAGHDKHGNEISVRELVAAIESYESIAEIAAMPESMRDALAMRAAENYRIKTQNEHQQRTIKELESTLNSAHVRISNLLSEHADIKRDAALSALAIYADPRNWANPRNQHGDLQTEQRSVFIKGFHGFEIAAQALQQNKEQAA
ncbi:hypothetical protein [Marinomonas shanghaiensis]|uniref:hypothetical protein n=1 Tax=Marinomonas shanghaiensis TaxID=2202418 RepID=UPI000DB9F8C4|nr:hypothetical protein [Marinomonas shanghaiensis]